MSRPLCPINNSKGSNQLCVVSTGNCSGSSNTCPVSSTPCPGTSTPCTNIVPPPSEKDMHRSQSAGSVASLGLELERRDNKMGVQNVSGIFSIFFSSIYF